MSDYTKLPRDIADCMKRAGSPLSEDQQLLLAGCLAPVQQKLSESRERVAVLEMAMRIPIIPCDQAWLLRKQAEAADEVNRKLTEISEGMDGRNMEPVLVMQYAAATAGEEAQRLRNQAQDAERAGGKK